MADFMQQRLLDGAICCSENGSNVKGIIDKRIIFLNNFEIELGRKLVPASEHVLLLIDGHSSRKGID